MIEKAPVVFLFNHDAGHQAAHSAGIAGALALAAEDRKVIAATGNENIRREVEKLLSAEQIAALEWVDLSLPSWLHKLLTPINRLVPIIRLARLYWHRSQLRKNALIISTERTCLTLKRHWQKKKQAVPRFAYIPHGSGDRNVAIHPALKDFDLCLVSGQKVVDQLVQAGAAQRENCCIIGYPKFDILRGRQKEIFFDNDRPTFVYNPHFDPHMSSWFGHGPVILEFFYRNADCFNLIFAPHVMLFQKTVHISPEYRVTRRRPDVDPKYFQAANIRIDTNSSRLFDMSYTLSADAYIGDVSSQIYEFLTRPRACFFIDVHGGDYDFWRNGPVVKNAAALTKIVPDFAKIAAQYRDIQIDRMAYTTDTSDPRPASIRGAAAILEYLEDHP